MTCDWFGVLSLPCCVDVGATLWLCHRSVLWVLPCCCRVFFASNVLILLWFCNLWGLFLADVSMGFVVVLMWTCESFMKFFSGVARIGSSSRSPQHGVAQQLRTSQQVSSCVCCDPRCCLRLARRPCLCLRCHRVWSLWPCGRQLPSASWCRGACCVASRFVRLRAPLPCRAGACWRAQFLRYGCLEDVLFLHGWFVRPCQRLLVCRRCPRHLPKLRQVHLFGCILLLHGEITGCMECSIWWHQSHWCTCPKKNKRTEESCRNKEEGRT